MNNYFKFKQFTIEQDRCAMKVGTDGVLLGAWANLPADERVARFLDIGSGSGLLSIIAAQRASGLMIDGIDIENDAVEQARENAEKSLWSSRIQFFNSSVQNFQPEYRYDYIVSNPPYFINSLKADHEARAVARHANTLSYSELAQNVDRLLTDEGIFSVIFPYIEANIFIVEAAKNSLFCQRRMDVRGTASRPVKRVLLQFRRQRGNVLNEELVIEEEQRHSYTPKYKELTKDLYLKF